MKKLIIFACMLSCFTVSFAKKKDKKEPAKETKQEYVLKTENDTLSYAVGIQNGEQMKNYLLTSRGLDTTQIQEFVNGFMEAMYPKQEVSRNFELGIQMGSELREAIAQSPLFPNDTTSYVNKDAFVDGLMASIQDGNKKMTPEEAMNYMQNIFDRVERKANEAIIAAEEAFLSENRKRDGVVETPSGLQYKIIRQGTGEIPGEGVDVAVHYTGTLTDGTKFDSSVDRGTPFEFNTSGGVIQAWLEAVKMMPVGSKWIIYAPSKLAYGSRDMGTIPAYSTLIFEIEVLDIVK